MSENTEDRQATPHELLERRRETARAQGRVPEGARAPQDRNRAGRRADEKRSKPLKPLGKDPIAFGHLGVEWQLYPKMFDDWGILEDASGIDFGADPVAPVPGEEAIAARDEKMGNVWASLWHMLGWGSRPDDEVHAEYRLLRETIEGEYGYLSSIAIIEFVDKAQDALGLKVDPQGN